jgi:hypothetical protein
VPQVLLVQLDNQVFQDNQDLRDNLGIEDSRGPQDQWVTGENKGQQEQMDLMELSDHKDNLGTMDL